MAAVATVHCLTNNLLIQLTIPHTLYVLTSFDAYFPVRTVSERKRWSCWRFATLFPWPTREIGVAIRRRRAPLQYAVTSQQCPRRPMSSLCDAQLTKLGVTLFILHTLYTLGKAGRSENRIPVGGEIFQTGSGAHPASCTMGTGSFPGGKVRPERDVHHPSSAVVKERVKLYLYSTSGPSWYVIG